MNFCRRFFGLCQLLFVGSALADGNRPTPIRDEALPDHPFKLTVGWYRFSGNVDGEDVNLRYTAEQGNFWIGHFHLAEQQVDQWRGGWDHTYGSSLRITPSFQAASQGFVGGSLQAEVGQPWFIGAGIGRTNLRPYWNLNFDPNDAYTLSGGYRSEEGQTLAIQYVRDNRQNPDQRHLHFLYRLPRPGNERVTVDILHKEGLVEGETVRRWGWSLTYDWPRYFVRLAWDPKVNFSPDDVWRLAAGLRF